MSLSFLSKKKFHTTNIRNVEQVWLREQAQEAEQRRLLELQRQIQEERQLEELQNLQESSGLISRSQLQKSKLEWMYRGPAALSSDKDKDNQNELILNGQVTASEFLNEKPEGELKQLEKSEDVERKKFKKEFYERKLVENRSEQFRRINEDPMFEIMRKQKEALMKAKNNPLKMKMAKEMARREKEKLKKSQKLDLKVGKNTEQKKPRSKHYKEEKYISNFKSTTNLKKESDSASHRHAEERRPDYKKPATSSHKRKRLTSEERRIKLEEFKQDGERHYSKQKKSFAESDKLNKESLSETRASNGRGFINKVKEEIGNRSRADNLMAYKHLHHRH